MAVLVAVAAVAGAWFERGPSPWVGGALVVAALASRWPFALLAASFVLAGGLATAAEAGLLPIAPGAFRGTVTLLGDPEPAPGGALRADVRLGDGRHLEAVARGSTVKSFRMRAAGERITISGRLRRSPPGSDWLRVRHVAGQLDVDEITGWSAGGWAARAANAVRATLQRGAAVLPERDRPLFLGFTLGDTRGQAADITDDFRGSGLTHLLAVSGENVAFVLALGSPLLRRLSLRPRFVVTLALISFFALVTRFEPSVLRASVMAALAVTVTTLGREASRLRLLALAVAALVMIDPFLVRALGFQLSVAACAGIVVLAPPLARAIPGPRFLSDPLAVTIAAQAGVAPILAVAFGGVPLASVPANLLAAPAAAAVMVWGVGAGLAAGLLGARVATVLHWPTGLMIRWIAGVAHWGASLPLGELHARHVALLAVGVVLALAGNRFSGVRAARSALRLSGCALIAVALTLPMVGLRANADAPLTLDSGAVLWRSNASSLLELDGRAQIDDVLQGLRRVGVRRLDVVVVRTSSSSTAASIDVLRRWGTVGQVLVPAGSEVAGATETSEELALQVGDLEATVTPDHGHLVVDVVDAAGAGVSDVTAGAADRAHVAHVARVAGVARMASVARGPPV
jgi:competence protein ComEC